MRSAAERAERFLDLALKEVDRLRRDRVSIIADMARLGEEVRRLRKENEITGAASTRSVHRHNERLQKEVDQLRRIIGDSTG